MGFGRLVFLIRHLGGAAGDLGGGPAMRLFSVVALAVAASARLQGFLRSGATGAG
jgi:hypothetical protein